MENCTSDKRSHLPQPKVPVEARGGGVLMDINSVDNFALPRERPELGSVFRRRKDKESASKKSRQQCAKVPRQQENEKIKIGSKNKTF